MALIHTWLLGRVSRFFLSLLIIVLFIDLLRDSYDHWIIVEILGVIGFLTGIPGFYLVPRPAGLSDHLLFLASSLTGFAASIMGGKPCISRVVLLLVAGFIVFYYQARLRIPGALQAGPRHGRGYWW